MLYLFSSQAKKKSLQKKRKKSNRKSSSARNLFLSKSYLTTITNNFYEFVYRRGRATIEERDALAQDSEIALKKKELEAEDRKKQSHDLVAENIKRELAESS